jgi:hypothetical protein
VREHLDSTSPLTIFVINTLFSLPQYLSLSLHDGISAFLPLLHAVFQQVLKRITSCTISDENKRYFFSTPIVSKSSHYVFNRFYDSSRVLQVIPASGWIGRHHTCKKVSQSSRLAGVNVYLEGCLNIDIILFILTKSKICTIIWF